MLVDISPGIQHALSLHNASDMFMKFTDQDEMGLFQNKRAFSFGVESLSAVNGQDKLSSIGGSRNTRTLPCLVSQLA